MGVALPPYSLRDKVSMHSAHAHELGFRCACDVDQVSYVNVSPICRWDEPDWGAEDRLNEPLVTLRPVVTARGLTPGGECLPAPPLLTHTLPAPTLSLV